MTAASVAGRLPVFAPANTNVADGANGAIRHDTIALADRVTAKIQVAFSTKMDEKQWNLLYARLVELFGSPEFLASVSHMFPPSAGETIAYLHEVFSSRLREQGDRSKRLLVNLKRLRDGDLVLGDEELKALIDDATDEDGAGADFYKTELADSIGMIARGLGVSPRDVRQFLWHAKPNWKKHVASYSYQDKVSGD